jgi:predicted 3-demethylubiquinone-9 3-methyltransferase (glyoxalase superfamily)
MSGKIIPFLWFKNKAQAAAKFHCSIFPNSKILSSDSMSVTYIVGGLKVMGLNGGPYYKLTPGFSFFVSCRTQSEIDYYWSRLSRGAKILSCGWLTDRFGVTWQIIPSVLGDLIGDSDRTKADRAIAAMMKMRKLDIAKLKAAHKGK